MLAARVHLHGRGHVGAEEAEAHQEHVQQARVVRVLDVLEHELPVGGNDLPLVAENAKLPSVEDPVEPSEVGLAEIVLERRHTTLERGEDDAVALGDGEPLEAVLGEREVGRHSSGALDPVPEGDAAEVAIEIIGPLVVRAHEALGASVRLRAELDAAVRAAVDEHVRPAVGRADDDHRDLADRRALEVTRARDLGGERDVAPARAPEDPLLLAPVDLGVGVHPVGDPAHALRRPRALRGAIEVVEGFHR